jgi:hypothetical protein
MEGDGDEYNFFSRKHRVGSDFFVEVLGEDAGEEARGGISTVVFERLDEVARLLALVRHEGGDAYPEELVDSGRERDVLGGKHFGAHGACPGRQNGIEDRFQKRSNHAPYCTAAPC